MGTFLGTSRPHFPEPALSLRRRRGYSINESIAQGWRSFVDIGLALSEIRKAELYAGEFETFEKYYRIKWDFKHSKANYLMAAAQVLHRLVEGLFPKRRPRAKG